MRRWTGQTGEAGYFDLAWSSASTAATATELRGAGRRRERAPPRRSACSSATSSSPRARTRRASGREGYGLAAATSSAPRSTSTRPTPGAGPSCSGSPTRCTRSPTGSSPGADVDDAVAHLDADPARVVHGREAFRDWMQELADGTIDDHGRRPLRHPRAGPPHRVHARADQRRRHLLHRPVRGLRRVPGRMWWSVPEGIDDFHPWREVTTVYHEGVPGHHLQVAQTAYRSDTLNRWQRLMCWCSGHGEGWALYAERLMDELGYLDDPGDLLGMLDGQSLRATRVIVDIGMHLELEIPADNRLGAGGTASTPARRGRPSSAWSSCGCTAGWTTSSSSSRSSATSACPGQAPSYKVGERIWLEARAERAGAPGRRLRPQGLPPRGARPGLARPRPAPRGAGAPVSTPRPRVRLTRTSYDAARRGARPDGHRQRGRRVPAGRPAPGRARAAAGRAQVRSRRGA